jgi:inward rectifier potassium channel
MSRFRKLNSRAKVEINTGVGVNASDYGGRFINKNGDANIEKKGLGFFEKISWYHTLLKLPAWQFIAVIFIFFITINLLFAVIYYAIGVKNLSGIVYSSNIEKFAEAFFFSCQTFTTVGYGRINPVGFATSTIAALEALIGLLSFALATGLLYGRFAKPKAYLRFSDNALLAPYKGITAIMMRVAPFKNATLVDAEAKVTLGLSVEEDGKVVNKFFPLSLEFNTVNALTLSWTLVHPITDTSPLYKFNKEDFSNTRGEILVYLKAFDDMFSNTVVARTSYTFSELIIGAKFKPMFVRSDEGERTILHLDKLNSYIAADVSYSFSQEKNAS